MKNFSKTLISMAAVMAVGSAMAVSAFASMSASYKDGTLTVTGAGTHGDKQTIMLVAGTNADGLTAETDTYNPTGGENGTIKHINQDDTASADFNGDISVQALADGNYKLMVSGSDGQVESYKFTVSSTPVVQTETIMVGDADLKGSLNAFDLTYIKRKVVNKNRTEGVAQAGVERYKTDGTKVVIGDADLKGSLNAFDLTYIKRKVVNKNRTEGVAQAGTTIEVVK